MAVGDMPQATALASDLEKTNADSAAVQTAVGTLATMKKDAAAARQAFNRALVGESARLPGAGGPAHR